MKHLRWSLLALLIHLAVFYNIERLDFGRQSIIDIQSFVYVLGLLALVSIIFIPTLWRLHVSAPLSLWLGVYIICRVTFFNDRPLLGGIDTYLTITELAALSLLIVLTHNVARDLHDFEEAVKNITFADVSRRVQKLEDASENIQLELIRSRRHHYPLTIMLVEPDAKSIRAILHRTVQEVQQAMIARYVITSLARVISKQLRRTDMVLDQHERGRFIIISPDTSASNSDILAQRIKAAAAEQLGVIVSCGVASFPDEALTFEELVHQAETSLQSSDNALSKLPVYTPNEVNQR
ncbi:MAG: diguanylate cyclase [Chloroflexi bacterium]|nr:diguanylate cyclase [Chloroflexota bacterium]